MLGTLLIVWGFGTLFGSIALGKWEEHCNKPKQKQQPPIQYKMNWQTALGIGICLFIILWELLLEYDPALLKQ